MPVCLVIQPIHPVGIERLAASGIEVRLASGSDMDTVAREIRDVDAVITRDAGLSAKALDNAARLLVVANHGAGTNRVDVAHARSLGIPVVYTPNLNARSVAEHTLMLMMAVGRHVVAADRAVRQGNWRFRFEQPMQALYGKTLGIVGFGAIGRAVAAMAVQAFGLQVLAWSPSLGNKQDDCQGVHRVDTLAELLRCSDIVSLHRPLRPDTYHTLDRHAFAQMKRGAMVINTSRGSLIDEAALVDALKSGHLSGAGLDVFDVEPLDTASPLTLLDNVVLTPHSAGATEQALRDTALCCAEQIMDVLSDVQPKHLVDASVWPVRRRRAGAMPGTRQESPV
jgi:D-3-phosphoglycerate dehydrogenase / 2-oxoglutarate reductase